MLWSSYLFDHNSDAVLDSLFSRVYHALKEGGVFIFDVIIPGQVPLGETVKNFTEGQDWIVLVEKQEDLTTEILTRRIISLRQINDLYRRSEEVHHQRLFNPTKLTEKLQQIGFQVEITNYYGQFQLPPARIAVIARKGL